MERITFIGIEPGDGHSPFTFAVLDEALQLLALSRGSLEAVLAYAAGQSRAVAAVSGPLRRVILFQESETGERRTGRAAEQLLASRGIPVLSTPQEGRRAPLAARRAFELGVRLGQLGFGSPDQPDLQLIEAQAGACFWVLLGCPPFSAGSLEGRIQRQLVLYEEKLPLPDPMGFFEEVTRFKLLHGNLPDRQIFAQAELDALAAAYTAWLSVHQPGRVERVGDADEGEIVLPMQQAARGEGREQGFVGRE